MLMVLPREQAGHFDIYFDEHFDEASKDYVSFLTRVLPPNQN